MHLQTRSPDFITVMEVGTIANRARFPRSPRNECLLCPFIGLRLPRVFPLPFHGAQRQIIEESNTMVVVHMATHMSQFVQ